MSYRKKPTNWISVVLGSRIFQICLLVLIAAMAWQVAERYQVERMVAERRAQTEAEYRALLEQRQTLQSQVSTLQDTLGVETEIRRNFDVAKEGEQIVIILEPELQATPQRTRPVVPSVESSNETQYPWYQFWR